MNTMLDKAQTAIASYCAPLGISTIREERLAIARATLQAIREVDERSSVFYDGLSAMGGYNDSGPVEPWQAMIDAILEEKPE